ncbi:MAG: GNAT family N-acetyltransferase [Atopostipes sp.]|nr:GNAT family N-acetyltransferase [Atopostipes sp.]
MVNYRLFLAKYNRIKTDRLKLRPINMLDAEDIYEYSSRASNTYYVYPKHRSIDDTEFSIANHFMASPLGKYGIELKEEEKLIGTIDIRIQAEKRSAEIGYILNEDYQRKGLGKEAAEAILVLAFEILELEKITASCQSENKASEALMVSLGMKKESELRNHEIGKHGKWVNQLQYGILHKEYLQQKDFKMVSFN